MENQEVIARWPLGTTLPRTDTKHANRVSKRSVLQASQSSQVVGDDGGADLTAIDKEVEHDAALQNPFPSKNSRKAREKLLSKLRIVGSNVPIIATQQHNIEGDGSTGSSSDSTASSGSGGSSSSSSSTIQ